MSHSSARTSSFALASGREPRSGGEQLYKADYPRAIDRYIDFFGERTPPAGSQGDSVLLALA
jgi:hypothetical protein